MMLRLNQGQEVMVTFDLQKEMQLLKLKVKLRLQKPKFKHFFLHVRTLIFMTWSEQVD